MKKLFLPALMILLSLGLWASALVDNVNAAGIRIDRDPTGPYNLMATIINVNDVLLVWENPVFINQPQGFRVFCNNTLARQLCGANVTDCTLEDVCMGCHQFYVVAYFDNGSQTPPSNIAELTINQTSNQDVSLGASAIRISAYPNPSRSFMNITLSTNKRNEDIGLSIYNLKGQVIKQHMVKGNHTWQWDGKDEAGRAVSEGVYFLKAKTREGSLMHKLKIAR